MNDTRGFQLIDCLLTLLVLATLLAIAIPWSLSILQAHRLQQAGHTLVSRLNRLRAESLSVKAPLSIFMNPDLGTYGFAADGKEPGTWHRLPSGVSVEKIPTRPVTFYSRGIAAPAGSYVLGNGKSELKVIVSPSGRVRWELLP